MQTLYCERVVAGAEPLNALSNLGFFVAAWLAWRLAVRNEGFRVGGALLAILILAIGIGSTAFHAIGTPTARYLDIFPIVLFQLVFVGLYATKVRHVGRASLAAALCAFIVGCWLGDGSEAVPGGSLAYAPALGVGLGFAWYRRGLRTSRFGQGGAPDLRLAAAVFLLALIFRSADPLVCPAFPYGTHFAWHLLVPGALYLAVRGFARDLI